MKLPRPVALSSQGNCSDVSTGQKCLSAVFDASHREATENARKKNAAQPKCRARKCETGKCRSRYAGVNGGKLDTAYANVCA